MSVTDAFLTGLSSGAVEIVDLTAPLSHETPILQLSAPFANTIAAHDRRHG